jgi:hypothetical protein
MLTQRSVFFPVSILLVLIIAAGAVIVLEGCTTVGTPYASPLPTAVVVASPATMAPVAVISATAPISVATQELSPTITATLPVTATILPSPTAPPTTTATITATATRKAAAPTIATRTSGTNPTAGRVWDERLTKRGTMLIPARVKPGQGYWRLIRAQWYDINDPPLRGKHHIFIDTLDQSGKRQAGVRIRLSSYPDAKEIFGYIPTESKAGEPYATSFAMTERAPAYRVEPDDGAPADAVTGMGLGSLEFPGMDMLTSYGFTWQWTVSAQAVPTPTPIASGTGPSDALTVPASVQRFVSGQRIWYAFRYAGDGSQLQIQLHVEPQGAASFALWMPDDVQRWAQGNPENPIGRGTSKAELGGDLVWTGKFFGPGIYYVVVDSTSPYAGIFTLKVTGSGVSPAGKGS